MAASLFLAAPASASASLSCVGEGGNIDVSMGRLVVLKVLGAVAEVDDTTYSTDPERGPGEPFEVGQAFAEDGTIMIDFVDPNIEHIVVGLRVDWDEVGGTWTGTLSAGEVSVDVACDMG